MQTPEQQRHTYMQAQLRRCYRLLEDADPDVVRAARRMLRDVLPAARQARLAVFISMNPWAVAA